MERIFTARNMAPESMYPNPSFVANNLAVVPMINVVLGAQSVF